MKVMQLITDLVQMKRPEKETQKKPEKTEYEQLVDAYQKYLIKHYGPRCLTLEPGCQCCANWKLYDLFRMMVVDCDK